MSLQQYDSWKRFDMAIKTKATGRAYRQSVILFMKYLKLDNPDQLLSGSDEFVHDKLEFFLKDIIDRGRSDSLAKVRLAGIKLFYRRNRRRTIDFEAIADTVPQTKKRKDSAYVIDHISKVLAFADPREKASILLLASTGMRVGALPELRVKHLIPIDKYGIYKVIVYEGYDEEYYTFCTPEARQAIDAYIEYRRRAGEKVEPESPLFRTSFNADQITKPRPMTERGLSDAIKRDLLAAGVRAKITLMENEEKGAIRHPIKTIHGLRKFYDTQTSVAGISPLWVEMLEGHNIKLKESYFRPSETDLLEGNDRMAGYVDAVDFLTINEEKRLQKKVKVLEVKAKAGEKVEALEKIVADSTLKNDAMLKRLAEQEDKNKELAETVAMLVEAQKEREDLEKHKEKLE